MQTCATAERINPIKGLPGKFEVIPPLPVLNNSFYVNLISSIALPLEYLLFDGNKIAQMQLANAPEDLVYGSSFDPAAIATGTQLNELLARLSGSSPMILKKMRVTVTSQQLFQGTITVYTGNIGGTVSRDVLDNNAAVNPSNNQGNVLDFELGDIFVLDGFIGIGILLPVTLAVQTYSITFEISGVPQGYTMQSPCISACDVIG